MVFKIVCQKNTILFPGLKLLTNRFNRYIIRNEKARASLGHGLGGAFSFGIKIDKKGKDVFRVTST